MLRQLTVNPAFSRHIHSEQKRRLKQEKKQKEKELKAQQQAQQGQSPSQKVCLLFLMIIEQL